MVEAIDEHDIEKRKDQEFTRQWERLRDAPADTSPVSILSVEDLPACPVGIRLLRIFAEAHPGPYELALQKGLYDLTPPVFAKLPRWQAFVQHRKCCADCNEG
ncbi:hypothetical protein SAMN05421770_101844 [Granulicella rosea]|uniref:Uncharacterized protein n=1 Tax=Granulicella rosea TaxID=474952 RepID=A0A239E8U6_9BACT|nr:hypothetical protein [Granulicella rosea]SNS40708.1 hypothetical protein SAMN05421770_101844 [Granulicella rosea]